MKPYGVIPRKPNAYCVPHDERCHCDNVSKKAERQRARKALGGELLTLGDDKP